MSGLRYALAAVGLAGVVVLVARLLPKRKRDGSLRDVAELKKPAGTLPIMGNILDMNLQTMRHAFIKWGQELDDQTLYTITLVKPIVFCHDYETVKKVFVDGQANYNEKVPAVQVRRFKPSAGEDP
jgi:hypothetical protein